MLLSKFIDKLKSIQAEHGDLDVCIAVQNWEQFVLLTDGAISVPNDVYAVDDDEEIVPGYEKGKTAVVLGNI